MLARVDGAGIVRSGEYALTRLAAAVVEYFLADEAEQAEPEEAVQRVIEHVDRIAVWGGARQGSWSSDSTS